MRRKELWKKYTALLLIFCMVFGFGGGVINAEEMTPTEIRVNSLTGKGGDEVTISVEMDADSKLMAGMFEFLYDSTKFEIVYDESEYEDEPMIPRVKIGEALEGSTFDVNVVEEGRIKVGVIKTAQIRKDGNIFDVTLKVKDDVEGGESPITLNVLEFRNDKIELLNPVVKNGSVKILAH